MKNMQTAVTKEKVIAFVPQTEDFSYNENDVMNFFEDKNLDCLVLVNPDNPTGNYISREGMLKLARWTKEKDIRFLADESFVDFAEETEPTLLVEELLDENPHMIVVKSISKSYGIPGLRLGVAASGDTDLIGQLKKDVAIWNINSFGEFYMQIEEKYRKRLCLCFRQASHRADPFCGKTWQSPRCPHLPIPSKLPDGGTHRRKCQSHRDNRTSFNPL